MSAPKGVIRLGEKDYPTWPFVLDKAHSMGLLSIETELVQIPSDENGKVAIVRAVATFAPATEGGPVRRFSGIGDAGPHNVNAKIVGATLRMAETRAMGRALRTGTNIGETMFEELPGQDEERQESRGDRYAREMPAERWGAKPAPLAGAQAAEQAARQGVPLVRHSPGTVEGDAAISQARLVCSAEGCGTILRPAQVTLSEQRFGKRLCAVHQDEEAGK